MRRLGPAPESRIAVVRAGGGIGQALVATLDCRGRARVIALDLPQSLGSVPGGVADACPLDATDPDAVATGFAAAGAALSALDAMVNLAGYLHTRTPTGRIAPEDRDGVVRVNFTGRYL